MSLDLIISSLRITVLVEIMDSSVVEKRLLELVELEEHRFIIAFHNKVYKVHEKA